MIIFIRNNGKMLLFVLCVILAVSIQLDSAEPGSIFFYNPDANIENVELLIRVFNNYFQSEIDNFRLQPFVNVETFINITLQRKPGFLILPYWNYKLISKDMSFASSQLKGILTPISSSNPFYNKIILVNENAPFSSVSDLQGSIASTSLGLQSLDFLNEFVFKNRTDLSNLEFTWTTKDIDSLLALRFGQVQIAIINESSYEETKASRPQLVMGMKILETSDNIPHSVVVKLDNNIDDATASKVESLFSSMHDSTQGKAILNLLGYDKWIEFSE